MAINRENVKIHVAHLKKNFGKLEVLKDVSTDIYEGEVVVIIGPSGSGKSTFLRCMNRLEDITGGTVIVDGCDITDKKTDINRVRENVGMVFQHFNLFGNMNVLRNLTLAPVDLKKADKQTAQARAVKLLERVGLADKAQAYPSQLSGGQKQRVAIARALAMNPDIMLLHIELDDEIPEEDRTLCGIKYGKTISRDILVQQNLPLHNLHYVINQAFGFTNSHMHEFELSSEDLKWVTAGKVENWKKLVGLVFKNPLRDEDLDFWDDDYEGGSPKKWMRSKYTGPGYVKCYEEGYRNVIQELGNWKVRAKSLEELLHKYESNPFSVNEVLSIYNILELDPSYPRSFDEFYEVLAENIEDAATYPDDSTLSQPWVRGFAKELHYTYDFGDSWQFTITPKYDAEYLVKAGRVTEKGIREAIQRVCVLARPVILAADGYPLIDDCGGIDGYVESLRAIEDGDKDSKAWAEGMGWKKKIDKGVL